MTSRTAEPVDALSVRARVRTLRIGAWPSVFACVCLGIYAAWTWEGDARGPLMALSAFGLVASLALAYAPIGPLVRSRWREWFFLGWSVSLIGLVTVATALDGGVTSPIAPAYFGPLAYAALCYPLRLMVTVAVIDLVAFLGLAALGGAAAVPFVFIFASSLVAAAWICASQAFNLERQRRDLARVSRTDPLTGALNRRGFEERLAVDLFDAQRDARPITLVLFDLDDFKQVNDSKGHAAGDELLRWVVERLRDAIHPRSGLGRLGGDEFAVVLHDDPAHARVTVARLLDVLGERTGVSAGTAGFPVDGLEAEELHHAADLELYETKQGGPKRSARPAARQLSWAAAPARCVDGRMVVRPEHSQAGADDAAAIADLLAEQIPLASSSCSSPTRTTP